ncbi:MAG: hypothetical protein H7Z75_02390 [Ferruginibacter sp.]|nr:hypothetical protein [Cytophagales bacterium]
MSYSNQKILAVMAATAVLAACDQLPYEDLFPKKKKQPKVELKDRSVTPSLVKTLPGFDNLRITTLIGSEDQLDQSPAFIYGGQPDGAALLESPDKKGFLLVTNHEIARSVSRVYLDETLKPVKGEYLVNAAGGLWRLCSATLATPQEHGFGPTFLTAGESGAESMVHAIDPLAPADPFNVNRVKPALGRASMENAVPLPKDAFPGKTVVIIGEDDGNGQLVAYVSDAVGDLENGKLYVLKRTNQDPVETSMDLGGTYEVEFVEIEDAKTLTGSQIAAQTVAKNAIQFARVEDVDYRKGGNGNGREIYFTATGVSQADRLTPVEGKTMWGRVYQLNLDADNPFKGTLSIIADGAGDPGNNIVNPDNICVTTNYVYIQEDGDSFYRENKHDGIIWQYAMGTKALKPMIIMDHRRDDPAFNAKYNPVNSALLSSWEYGAMLDISDLVRIPDTFLINIHPHTWQESKFANPDGSGLITNQEGGQTVVVKGIPR